MVNNSVIPDTQSYKTISRLSSLSFENNDILKLKRSLNIQKAHGFDDISIHIIKICDSALAKPLLLISKIVSPKLIFQNTFPDI